MQDNSLGLAAPGFGGKAGTIRDWDHGDGSNYGLDASINDVTIVNIFTDFKGFMGVLGEGPRD